MAPISSTALITFLSLSALSSTTAFVSVGPSSARILNPFPPLYATSQAQESFQRSLLAARIAYDAVINQNGASSALEASPAEDAASSTHEPEAVVVVEPPPVVVDTKKQESFQRMLLAARIANDVKKQAFAPVESPPPAEEATPEPVAVASAAPPAMDTTKQQESFQRSLLSARIANDAKAATLAAAAEPEPAPVAEETPVEPEPQPEPEPEPVVASTPEPTTPTDPITTASESTPPPKEAPQPTEFSVPRELALVPINEASVQFTAGLLGATAGYLLGGPILAALFAATSNYLSRKDEDPPQRGSSESSPKKVVDTASQTVLLMYNYIANFEKQNKVVDTTLRVLESVVDKAKESESAGETIKTVESTLGTVVKTVGDLNDDFDFMGGAGTVLNSVGDLIEISVDKVVELNGEYRLTDRVGGVVKGALKKVTGDDK